MRIGINASFLRKPGTGIGQVTLHFLETLRVLPEGEKHEFFLYGEESFVGTSAYPSSFHFKTFLPLYWKRDDLVRKFFWERQLAQEAKKDKCDALLSLYQSGTPTIDGLRHGMIVHDIIPEHFPEYRDTLSREYYWKFVRRAIRKADVLVAVSQATENDLVEFGIDREKITVASPSVAPVFLALPDETAMDRVRKTYGVTPGYIYHGGGLEVRKNTEGLLRAYALLVEKEVSGLLDAPLPPLVISGRIYAENNSLATPVRALLRELSLEQRVRLLDFVPEEDLPSLYRGALFFAYPSKYEGFGLPVLEALHMRVPLLTSDTSSLPEVAGKAALYIDPERIDSIASGLERLLLDTELRRQLSEAALVESQKYDWHRFTKSVLESFMV